MKCKKLYKLKKNLDKEGLIFSYSGIISQGILEEISEAFKKLLKKENIDTNIIQRVFSIIIEQVQNIMKYSEDKNTLIKKEFKSGVLTIGKKNDKIFIESGNLVNNNKKKELIEQLDSLKNMDKNELKKYYLKKLKDNSISINQSAGLGFIEIARRSSEPLEYKIKKINNKYSFFSLKAVI